MGSYCRYDLIYLLAASSYVMIWWECVLLPVGLCPPTIRFEMCDLSLAASSYVIPHTNYFELYDMLPAISSYVIIWCECVLLSVGLDTSTG